MAKSLKQIREGYDRRFVPEKVMLEASIGSKLVPSSKEMPPLLLFRRITYKIYPNKQVIALYYAKSIDKYLSVPFGPGGNVNLREARIIDPEIPVEYEEIELPTCTEAFRSRYRELKEDFPSWVASKMPQGSFGKKLQNFKNSASKFMPGSGDMQTSRDKASKGNYLGAAGDFIKGGVKGAVTGAAAGAAALGLGHLATGALAGAGAGAASVGGLYAAKKALDMVTPGTVPDPKSKINPMDKPKAKTTTSSKLSKPAGNAVTQSKLKNYDLKAASQSQSPQQKLQEMRRMVKEGVSQRDIDINGKPITINTGMAKRILEVYDSVNTKNKKIVESMLSTDLESFKKLLNFSVKA